MQLSPSCGAAITLSEQINKDEQGHYLELHAAHGILRAWCKVPARPVRHRNRAEHHRNEQQASEARQPRRSHAARENEHGTRQFRCSR